MLPLVLAAALVAACAASVGHVPAALDPSSFGDVLHRDGVDRLGVEDGLVPDGSSPFDDIPALSRLDADLLDALRAAAADAAQDGIRLVVTSGWRSTRYQQRLYDEALAEHGSEAGRWAARPGTSVHETGGAVDLGPVDAQHWLETYGAGHGLCRTYDNEPWHYELRPEAVSRGCPATYADASADPRLQS
ncbi:D-alanyl-D-alanine carboxypeptidase family protein [Nocardioides caeni]|uniref:D-alanyl-D-alanine carboxypeptidase family protein n=1 Tax=Nocardioides caeni TaxID=574700 RepID=UPI00193115D0|nr:D-alanyl-D-alanine carboxypeptidase family protein [Nocardioides caeni]